MELRSKGVKEEQEAQNSDRIVGLGMFDIIIDIFMNRNIVRSETKLLY
jgi:hypothetical protein